MNLMCINCFFKIIINEMKNCFIGRFCTIRKALLKSDNLRTRLATKNILYGFAIKGLSILFSLLLVSCTLNYVNSAVYGIWLTLTSIISWFSFFDFGLTHGFRNKYAEAMANGNIESAKQYVSTTMVMLILIFCIFFLVAFFLNVNLDWNTILHTDDISNHEMRQTVNVILIFFCLQMVLSISNTILIADQKPALSSFLRLVGQFGSLVLIYVFTLTVNRTLVPLAYAISGVPTLVMFVYSIWMFSHKYKFLLFSIKNINLKLFNNIFGLGFKFFLIQTSMLVIYQFANVIISRELGAEYVTQYNIAYKYFNIVYMGYTIIILPFWSAFTDAYTKNDYSWMRKSYKVLSRIQMALFIPIVLLIIISPYVYRIWLNSSVEIPWQLSIVMGIYMFIISRANLYMHLINGMGKVVIQLIIYVSCSLFALPAMLFMCRFKGLIGLISIMAFVMLLQAIWGHIQLSKLLRQTAQGIWAK